MVCSTKLIIQWVAFWLIYMNTCWVPRLEISPEHFTMAIIWHYSLLLSQPTALQSYATLNERLTFHSEFLNIHQSGVLSTVWLSDWCHKKLQPSCTPYNQAPVYSHYIWRYVCRVDVCFTLTCHLHFWQNDGDLHATAVTQGWNGYWNKSAQKAGLGQDNSPATPAGNGTHDILVRSPSLYHWAIPTHAVYISDMYDMTQAHP